MGTGDLFTALTTAWLTRTSDDAAAAMEKVIGTMQAVLTRTVKHAGAGKGDGPKPSAAAMELKLIQSKRDIEEPETKIKAVEM